MVTLDAVCRDRRRNPWARRIRSEQELIIGDAVEMGGRFVGMCFSGRGALLAGVCCAA